MFLLLLLLLLVREFVFLILNKFSENKYKYWFFFIEVQKRVKNNCNVNQVKNKIIYKVHAIFFNSPSHECESKKRKTKRNEQKKIYNIIDFQCSKLKVKDIILLSDEIELEYKKMKTANKIKIGN